MKKIIQAVTFAFLAFVCMPILADVDTAPVDDAAITQGVQAKIAAEPALAAESIITSTNQGVVNLSGNLKTNQQAVMAVQAAESVPGVKDVDISNLTVKNSKHPVDDTIITAKIKGMFLQEKLFGDTGVPLMSIHVDTKNGVVYLTGMADSKEQLSKAVDLAKSVNGVKKVEAKARIKA